MNSIPTSFKLSSVIKGGITVADIAKSAPENLMFFSNAELLEDYEYQPSYIKNAILSELLVRFSFNTSNSELSQELLKFIPENSLTQFKTWLQHHNPSYKPKPPINLIPDGAIVSNEEQEWFNNLENCIFTRLEKLYGECDGILPVVVKDVGIAIPFTLEYADGEIDPLERVVDLDNTSFPEWSRAVSDLVKSKDAPDSRMFLHNYVRIRLLFHSNIIDIRLFNGNSLQFPVLLAFWRKENLLPTYSPFSIIATGEINDKRIRRVEALQKFNSLKKQFNLLTFFCPSSSGIKINDDPLLTIIDANTSIEDIISICQNRIENLVKDRSSRNIILNSDYIKNRIDAITIYTKKDLESRWDQLISALLFIEKRFRRLSNMDEETYLNCLASLSFAYCHCGKTAEAIQYNRKGRKYAKKCNLINTLNGLLIHQLVLFQDMDDLSSVSELSKEIYSQISQVDIDQKTQDDLLMRYHGTMAQVHIYGTLADIDGFCEKEALKNVDLAIDYAQKSGRIVDIIRDFNYRHLYYAFFKPGSEDERGEYMFARNYLQENSDLFEDKEYNGNLQFQFRQRCLAAYFQILRENQCNDANIIKERYPSINNPIYWLKALSFKYLGAVNAFCNNGEEAQKYYDEAVELLEKDPSPLFKYICMTIASDAYRSFSVLGDAQTAERYRQKALEMFSANGDFISFRSSTQWLNFLNASWEEFHASGEDFPGLHYYY